MKKTSFIALLLISQGLMAKTVCIQLFVKSDHGMTKKIAIIGEVHLSGPVEYPYFEAIEKVFAPGRTTSDRQHQDLITILTESGTVDIEKLSKNKAYRKAILQDCPTLSKLLLLPKNPSYTVSNADTRREAFAFIDSRLKAWGPEGATNPFEERLLSSHTTSAIVKPEKYSLQSLMNACKADDELVKEAEQQLAGHVPSLALYFHIKHMEMLHKLFFTQQHVFALKEIFNPYRSSLEPLSPDLLLSLKVAHVRLSIEGANIIFTTKVLLDQLKNNRTALFCGSGHVTQELSNLLTMCGYKKEFCEGIFDLADMPSDIETSRPIITPAHLERFLRDFASYCSCGATAKTRCSKCHQRFCEACQKTAAFQKHDQICE
jgi:hypothetical protein